MDIQQYKRLIRQQMKQAKAALPFDEKIRLSRLIFNTIEQHSQFTSANTILAYWAMDDEVQTKEFIIKWSLQKQFVLPVVNGDELVLRRFTSEQDLKAGSSFSLLEPEYGELVQPGEIDLAIIPGIAFDVQGNRLGRGKGYYDRLLKSTKFYKIGVCFPQQLVDEIPAENTDIAMDKVVFE